jgi:primosomal protein N' (replication factor Y)
MKRVDSNTDLSLQFMTKSPSEPKRKFIQTDLNNFSWIDATYERVSHNLEQGLSTLVVLPDFRDIAKFEKMLTDTDLKQFAFSFASNQNGTSLYKNYLRALSEVGVVYGNRGAVFAPVTNLGEIILLDDIDESHFEISAPYWNSRDVLLVRQDLERCSLTFIGTSPSTEIIRLINSGYIERVGVRLSKPLVRITENQTRLDDETFGLISRSLAQGKPVLVQVANLGFATSLSCRRCNEVAACPECQAKLWQDPRKQYRCRSCKFATTQINCQCGAAEFRTLKAGSSSMKEWLEKAFAKAHLVHSTGEEAIFEVQRGSTLVIATPGAEPEVEGGYGVVVLADAANMLAFPRLRALEQASLYFANAISKLSSDGLAVYVGVTGTVADKIRASDFYGIVAEDYAERKELGLPPEVRMCSVTCPNQTDLSKLQIEVKKSLNDLIKLIDVNKENFFAFTYKYNDGDQVSRTLSELAQQLTTKSRNRKPGQRLFRIAMDDRQLI